MGSAIMTKILMCLKILNNLVAVLKGNFFNGAIYLAVRPFKKDRHYIHK